jgi:hypothetical protein
MRRTAADSDAAKTAARMSVVSEVTRRSRLTCVASPRGDDSGGKGLPNYNRAPRMNAPRHGDSIPGTAVRRFRRVLTWPIRRVLDPRFSGLSKQIAVTHEEAARRSDATLAQLSQHGLALQTQHETQLDGLQRITAALQKLSDDVEHLYAIVVDQGDAAMEANAVFGRSLSDLLAAADIDVPSPPTVSPGRGIAGVVDGSVTEVDEGVAHLLNYAESHRGFAAQRNLWFNPPISLVYKVGDVQVAGANERVAEIPYALRALASLPQGARILDVGAAESTLAFSLASLGYPTTALDLRPYPLSHPDLDVVVGRIEEWDAALGPFDAIICLSTIEHVGLRAYGGAPKVSADQVAMKRMRELLVSRGLLVLTAPVGRAASAVTERAYDRPALEALLEGWDVEDLTVVRQEDPTTWSPIEKGNDWGHDAAKRHVALVTARRSE